MSNGFDGDIAIGSERHAAAASPLVFQNLNDTKSRIWLSSTIVGGVAGGALAWVFTRGSSAPKGDAWRYGSPNAGVIGTSATPTGSVPAYGVSWGGPF